MSIRACLVSLAVAAALAIGCESRASLPVSPSVSDASHTISSASAKRFAAQPIPGKTVDLKDACDPETFNDPQTGVGPGTCSRPGGVRFQSFLGELSLHHSVGGWHMSPEEVILQVGDVLSAFNHGGETHTFTEVADFGGGMNTIINGIGGFGDPIPECLANTVELLTPGDSSHEEEEDAGIEKYQCCIHPWMRTIVRVVPSH